MNHFSHFKDESAKLIELKPEPCHVAIAERILNAYHRAEKDWPGKPSDQWTSIVESDLQDVKNLLNGDDPIKLAAYFQHYGEKFVGFGGFTLGWDGYYLTLSDLAALYKDKLLCLAEAVGALPLENPEQGEKRNSFLDNGEVIDLIEKKLCIDISLPVVCYILGLSTPQGAFHYRQLNAIYAAWKIKSFASFWTAWRLQSVREIGGGLGLAAFYSWCLGLRDYTLLDLPIGNAFAAHFLIRALGNSAVTLYGEFPVHNEIKVMPFWYRDPDKKYYLTMNQDGFPEIAESLVRGYLDDIAKDSSYFLSINQEAQRLKVPALLDGDKRFYKMERSRYWLREGYVEELYGVRNGC